MRLKLGRHPGRTHAIAASDLGRQGRRFLVFFLVPFLGLIPVPAKGF